MCLRHNHQLEGSCRTREGLKGSQCGLMAQRFPTYSRPLSAFEVPIQASRSNALDKILKYLTTSKRHHRWNVDHQEVWEDPGRDLVGGGGKLQAIY